MNYDTYIDKLTDMAITIADLKMQLKTNTDYANELQNTTNDLTIKEAESITGSSVHSITSGENEYSTWNDLYGCIEELVLAYNELKDEHEKYVAKDFSAEDMYERED